MTTKWSNLSITMGATHGSDDQNTCMPTDPSGVELCHLYRINGVEDHLHILTHIHPTIAIVTLVKDIKLAADELIYSEGVFPDFKGWQDGYGAFTESIKAKERLMNYIRNQEEHHKKESFLEEYKRLLEEHEIAFDEKYLL